MSKYYHSYLPEGTIQSMGRGGGIQMLLRNKLEYLS
jgi:hypothetical protein